MQTNYLCLDKLLEIELLDHLTVILKNDRLIELFVIVGTI